MNTNNYGNNREYRNRFIPKYREMQQQHRKVEWVRDQDFRKDGMVVTVWVLPLRYPKYRLDVGCDGGEDKVFRGFMLQQEQPEEGETTAIAINHTIDLDALEDIIEDACQYVEGLIASSPPQEDDHDNDTNGNCRPKRMRAKSRNDVADTPE